MPTSRFAAVRPQTTLARLLAVVGLTATVLLGGAGTALAHNVLVNSGPPNGASLDAGPRQVRLVFDQPVRPGYDTVTVVGPNGSYWTDAPAQVNGDTVTEAVRELGPAGTYSIGYRILSNDGHPVSGKLTFTLTKPGNGTPAPPPADQAPQSGQQDGGTPVWPWIVAAVVLVGAGLVLALRLGRSTKGR